MKFVARGAADHGEPGLSISFEESPGELLRNLAPMGLGMDALLQSGRLAMEHVVVARV